MTALLHAASPERREHLTLRIIALSCPGCAPEAQPQALSLNLRPKD
ncbi:hypothetical protein [Arthrobacter globiformis]|nr:hypothetical protein [Arthrobacter globiformis]